MAYVPLEQTKKRCISGWTAGRIFILAGLCAAAGVIVYKVHDHYYQNELQTFHDDFHSDTRDVASRLHGAVAEHVSDIRSLANAVGRYMDASREWIPDSAFYSLSQELRSKSMRSFDKMYLSVNVSHAQRPAFETMLCKKSGGKICYVRDFASTLFRPPSLSARSSYLTLLTVNTGVEITQGAANGSIGGVLLPGPLFDEVQRTVSRSQVGFGSPVPLGRRQGMPPVAPIIAPIYGTPSLWIPSNDTSSQTFSIPVRVPGAAAAACNARRVPKLSYSYGWTPSLIMHDNRPVLTVNATDETRDGVLLGHVVAGMETGVLAAVAGLRAGQTDWTAIAIDITLSAPLLIVDNTLLDLTAMSDFQSPADGVAAYDLTQLRTGVAWKVIGGFNVRDSASAKLRLNSLEFPDLAVEPVGAIPGLFEVKTDFDITRVTLAFTIFSLDFSQLKMNASSPIDFSTLLSETNPPLMTVAAAENLSPLRSRYVFAYGGKTWLLSFALPASAKPDHSASSAAAILTGVICAVIIVLLLAGFALRTQQLRKAKAAVARHIQDVLTAYASHELRNPLQSLILSVENLKDTAKKLITEAKEATSPTKKPATQLASLTGDINIVNASAALLEKSIGDFQELQKLQIGHLPQSITGIVSRDFLRKCMQAAANVEYAGYELVVDSNVPDLLAADAPTLKEATERLVEYAAYHSVRRHAKVVAWISTESKLKGRAQATRWNGYSSEVGTGETSCRLQAEVEPLNFTTVPPSWWYREKKASTGRPVFASVGKDGGRVRSEYLHMQIIADVGKNKRLCPREYFEPFVHYVADDGENDPRKSTAICGGNQQGRRTAPASAIADFLVGNTQNTMVDSLVGGAVSTNSKDGFHALLHSSSLSLVLVAKLVAHIGGAIGVFHDGDATSFLVQIPVVVSDDSSVKQPVGANIVDGTPAGEVSDVMIHVAPEDIKPTPDGASPLGPDPRGVASLDTGAHDSSSFAGSHPGAISDACSSSLNPLSASCNSPQGNNDDNASSVSGRSGASGSPLSSPPLRILLTERNDLNRALAKSTLEHMGHQVTAVDGGDRVIPELRKQSFDLIILDIFAARVRGEDTCIDLRQKGVTMPIFAMTSASFARDIQRQEKFKTAGFNQPILEKPADRAKFRSLLKTVMPR